VVSIIGLLVALLLPAVSRMQEQYINLQCAARVRQAGQLTMMYAHDNDDALPPGQVGTYITYFNAGNSQGLDGASLLIPYIEQLPKLGKNWPPPLEPDGDHRLPISWVGWQMFDCPSSPDQLAWWPSGAQYGIHTEYSAFFSKPGIFTDSQEALSALPPGFALWADNSWSNVPSLNFIDATWHHYSGYRGPLTVDIFVGMNAARADGSAGWVAGDSHGNRAINFKLEHDHYWWVVPRH
jgi:hypothetical protein